MTVEIIAYASMSAIFGVAVQLLIAFLFKEPSRENRWKHPR